MDLIIKQSLRDQIQEGYRDIASFAQNILDFPLHEKQVNFLRLSKMKSFTFLHAGNRWGKGEVAMIKGAWYAFYKPSPKKFKDKEVCILNTSISQDQANIVLDKFENSLTDKPKFKFMIKDIKYSPFPHITFKSGVVWWFRNASQEGKFLLGRSYLWVNFDEADYAKNIKKLITEIIEPRTWDYGGQVDVMTTPKGKRNAFLLYKEKKEENSQQNCFFRGSTLDNPFIDQVKLRERMKRMPKGLIDQNINGLWVDSSNVISLDAIHHAQSIATGLRKQPAAGARHINAWDLARSTTYLTRITIQEEPLQVVSFHRSKEIGPKNKDYWHSVIAKIEQAHRDWPGITVVDKTGLGDPVMEFISKEVNPIGLSLGESAGKGQRIKSAIIQNGISYLEMGKIGIPEDIRQITDDETWTIEDELRDFQENTEGIIWDAVCALFMGLYILDHKDDFQEQARPSIPTILGVRGANKHGTR